MADAFLPVDRVGLIARNFRQNATVIALIIVVFVKISSIDSLSLCENTQQLKVCGEGDCVNGTCICFPGWTGEFCEQCHGRIR